MTRSCTEDGRCFRIVFYPVKSSSNESSIEKDFSSVKVKFILFGITTFHAAGNHAADCLFNVNQCKQKLRPIFDY